MRDIWNPWHGCHKVSEGCANCYMFGADALRNRDGSVVYRVKNEFGYPIARDRQGRFKVPSGAVLRVCLTSDFFLEEADAWREEAWRMIAARSDVIFWLVTKRPERVRACLPDDWGDGWDNVVLNVTAENARRADERLPILEKLPFSHKGVLAAPLLGAIDFSPYLARGFLDYISVGGENYDGARVCDYDWVKSIYEQCVRADVTFEFYGTGALFRKDGKLYRIPYRKEREQARRSDVAFYQGRARTRPRAELRDSTAQLGIFDGGGE